MVMGKKSTSPLFGDAVKAFKRSEGVSQLPGIGNFQALLDKAEQWFKHPMGGLTIEQKRELGKAARDEGVKEIWIVGTRRVKTKKGVVVRAQKRDVLTGRWLSWAGTQVAKADKAVKPRENEAMRSSRSSKARAEKCPDALKLF